MTRLTRFLVGLDDTDDLESRGTGFRARQLAEAFARAGLEPAGVTRHQLLVDSRIPYTSHNSSACVEVLGEDADAGRLAAICRSFLRDHSAAGSDAGFCVARADQVVRRLIEFGDRAKRAIVTAAEAEALAAGDRVHLEPVTGSGIGVIGALAAVGLRAGADDGRFLWLPHLRDISGVHSAARLRAALRLDAIETEGGRAAGDEDRVAVGDWPRPLLRRGRAVLLVEEDRREDHEWIVARKDRIKQLSE